MHPQTLRSRHFHPITKTSTISSNHWILSQPSFQWCARVHCLLPGRSALDAFLNRMRFRTCRADFTTRRRWGWRGLDRHVQYFKARCGHTCSRCSSYGHFPARFHNVLRFLTFTYTKRGYTYCPETFRAATALFTAVHNVRLESCYCRACASISIYNKLHWSLSPGFTTALVFTCSSCEIRRKSKLPLASGSAKQSRQRRSCGLSVRVVRRRRVEKAVTDTASLPVVFSAEYSEVNGVIRCLWEDTGRVRRSKG